ncbi:MAG TPA: TonB-dependent receptor, partial [Polyangia bacterium]
WDYQARVDHTLGPGKVSVFAFGSHDTLGHKQYPETNAAIDFHRLDLRWQGAVGPGRLLVGTAIGADRSAVTLDPLIRLPVRIASRSIAPRASYKVVRDWYEVHTGVDSEVQAFDPRTERADARNQGIFKKRVAAASGAYLATTLRAGEWFELTPAMRYDVFYEGDRRRYEPGPRLRLRLRPFEQTVFKAQVGRFAQTASLPVAVPGFESFGLDSYGTQTSKQGSVGVEQNIGDALSLDFTSFYQRFKLTDLLNIFNIGYEDPRLLELRDGESYGFEVMLRRAQSHRAYGWISYTWSKSLRLVGPSGANAFSDWDQRHVFNLVAGLRLPKGFNVGGRLHLNTGRPYPLFDEEGSAGPPDYIRLPTFVQADLRIEKRFVLDRYVLDVYLEAVNTTLSKQVFDVKREKGERVEKYYQIVLPSLGIHAEW